jgi:putative transposase
MPRLRRIVIPGLPHHLTQRGNRRADTYRDTEDRDVYLDLLGPLLQQCAVTLFSYCLMTNHVHLVCTPQEKEDLSRLMHDLHGAYAVYYNRKYRFNGHLWQGRFYSCVLDPERFWTAIRYVERNPVRAGLCGKAESYTWSSAAARCGIQENLWLASLSLPERNKSWSAWLRGEDEDAAIKALRRHTYTGRPCGSESFLERLEQQLGCAVRPQKGGRPKRDAKADQIASLF